jgi:hypothetical protein
MLFKIYGERNSGTNFLCQLIDKNFGNVYGNVEGCKLVKSNKFYFWKHDIPQNDIDCFSNNTIKIFIFRKLEPWLVSMFNNPYQIRFKDHNFKTFLNVKLKIPYDNIYIYTNNKQINLLDEDKTIFEIRYYKYQKIKEYCETNNNIILVNLEYLQNNDNCIHFLKQINNKYNLQKTNFYTIDKYTKTNVMLIKDNNNIKLVSLDNTNKNKKYTINHDDYQEEIDKNKNIEIENEINNLTYFIK